MNPIQAMRDLFAAFTSTIEDVSASLLRIEDATEKVAHILDECQDEWRAIEHRKTITKQRRTIETCVGCGMSITAVSPCEVVKLRWQVGHVCTERIVVVSGSAQYEPHDVPRCLDRLPQIDRYGRIDMSPKETP
jgi:hypothetical protein